MVEKENLLEMVKKQKEESYEEWFESWYVGKDFEKSLLESAKQGFNGIDIPIGNNSTSESLTRRLRNPRTVELLKEKLPDFEVEYVKREYRVPFMGFDVKRTEEKIIIGWNDEVAE